jgi:S-DNA-T family DNA segregation ATPase FtsK/SpoIIIE
VGLVVVSELLFAVSALRARFPRVFWVLFGWPVLWWRMRRTWRDLAVECDLTTSRRPNSAVLGDLVVKGKALQQIFPRLWIGLPRSYRVTARVRLLPGQTPEHYEKSAGALEHAWRVHAVRVSSPERGRVELLAVVRDPISEVIAPAGNGSAEVKQGPSIPRQRDRRGGAERLAPVPSVASMLRVQVGTREDGRPWVLDLLMVPHWLIVGVTRSGKSTLLNALTVWLAPYPVALVGIDLKGGMSLMPYLPRLSVLATSRAQAADLLAFLVGLTEDRMAVCVEAGVSSVWDLPSGEQPVPVVIVVDEIAELFLYADRAGQEESGRATVALIRLAQLGAGLGVHLVIAGQRVGSDLGKGLTLLRSQLSGRVCHRVADEETVKMTLADKSGAAVEAALAISEEERGVAITTGVPGGWMRARSALVTTDHARSIASQYTHMRQDLPGLGEIIQAGRGDEWR